MDDLLSSKIAFIEAQTRLLESALSDPIAELLENPSMKKTMNITELQSSSSPPSPLNPTTHDPLPPPTAAVTRTGVYSDWSLKGKTRLNDLAVSRKTLRADTR